MRTAANAATARRLAGLIGDTVPATHRPGVSNPRIRLCQEYVMRTGGYDNRASLTVTGDTPLDTSPGTGHRRLPAGDIHTTFRAVAVFLGADAAIRAVTFCAWVSRDDFTSTEPVPCRDCEEVAHA